MCTPYVLWYAKRQQHLTVKNQASSLSDCWVTLSVRQFLKFCNDLSQLYEIIYFLAATCPHNSSDVMSIVCLPPQQSQHGHMAFHCHRSWPVKTSLHTDYRQAIDRPTSLPVYLQGAISVCSSDGDRPAKCFSASETKSSWLTPSIYNHWIITLHIHSLYTTTHIQTHTHTSSCSQYHARSSVVGGDVIHEIFTTDAPTRTTHVNIMILSD